MNTEEEIIVVVAIVALGAFAILSVTSNIGDQIGEGISNAESSVGEGLGQAAEVVGVGAGLVGLIALALLL